MRTSVAVVVGKPLSNREVDGPTGFGVWPTHVREVVQLRKDCEHELLCLWKLKCMDGDGKLFGSSIVLVFVDDQVL